jgi:hypothetical protein
MSEGNGIFDFQAGIVGRGNPAFPWVLRPWIFAGFMYGLKRLRKGPKMVPVKAKRRRG